MENHRISLILIVLIIMNSALSEKVEFRTYHNRFPYKAKHYDKEYIVKDFSNERDDQSVKKFSQATSHQECDSDKPFETELSFEVPDHDMIQRSADNEDVDDEKSKDNEHERNNDFKSYGGYKKMDNIAMKAAKEAQAAVQAQDVTGKEASKQAKIVLAEKAIQSAKAAQAALSAKEAILNELMRELREAEMVVQDLSSSIQQSESNANSALKAYQQAQVQLKMLTEIIQVAQSSVGYAEQAAQGSQQELNEKTQLLDAAKNRVEKLMREIKSARTDFTNTKKEAYKASMAAKEAKQNA